MYFQVAHVDPTKRNHTLRAAKVRSFLGMCKFLLLIFTSLLYFLRFCREKAGAKSEKRSLCKEKAGAKREKKGIGQRLTSPPDSYE
jgi:hypothetical protein